MKNYDYLPYYIAFTASLSFIFYICFSSIIFAKFTKDMKKRNEYYWIRSKILTIKNIVYENRYNSFPLLNIISKEENITLDMNYEYLLNHSTKDKCEKGFKKCGILDTYGNIMCISSEFPCPINEIIIDDEIKKNEYIDKGFNSTKLDILPKDKILYYTNNSIDKEIVVKISFDTPKYFTLDNLIIDEFIKEDEDGDIIFNYVIKKINSTDNIDEYYKKIYNNLYIKNYIGFQNFKQMNDFMNINYYKLYKREFPNLGCFLSLILLMISYVTLSLVVLIYFIITIVRNRRNNDYYESDFLPVSIICGGMLIFSLGYYIYCIYAYFSIYNKDEFLYVKKIKSDKFIQQFINEFTERFGNKTLILCAIFFLHFYNVFSLITVFGVCLSSSNKE